MGERLETRQARRSGVLQRKSSLRGQSQKALSGYVSVGGLARKRRNGELWRHSQIEESQKLHLGGSLRRLGAVAYAS